MRDCMFFVADKSMGETFKGFLARSDRAEQLGCGPFRFDADHDLRVAAGEFDSGIWRHAAQLTRAFQHSHARLVVALDCRFEGTPGQATLIDDIANALCADGWQAGRLIVIAIDPDLEQWIWQDSPVLEEELRHAGPSGLRASLAQLDLWPADAEKPPQPKKLFKDMLLKNRVKNSSAIYRRIAEKVPVLSCTDPQFARLAQQLRDWFPPNGQPGQH